MNAFKIINQVADNLLHIASFIVFAFYNSCRNVVSTKLNRIVSCNITLYQGVAQLNIVVSFSNHSFVRTCKAKNIIFAVTSCSTADDCF